MAEKIVIWKGCGSCQVLKKNGLCKTNQCVEITSKKGTKIATEAKVTTVPQKVCQNKTGKWEKCNTNPIIKKFSKKKR